MQQVRGNLADSYGPLLYAATLNGTEMLSYPTHKLVGTLSPPDELGSGCVDSTNGNVLFVVGHLLLEYTFGQSQPTEEIHLSASASAETCAVDPLTGDLAVVFLYNGGSGYVGIFTNLSGEPSTYTVPGMGYYAYCGYDNKGDLFVDGQTQGTSNETLLGELTSGSQSFNTVALPEQVRANLGGSVQWDGTSITVQGDDPLEIYRLAIHRSKAKLVGKVTLRTGSQFAADAPAMIQGNTVTMPLASGYLGEAPDELGFWKYPKGGDPEHIWGRPIFKRGHVYQAFVNAGPQ
ncbi:MAG TPA: hypothetical protein VGX91_12945 [Candidatus Cybelea sp.]|nr:hypothetical protein [Candidatus Cybelea sp.]